MSEGFSLEALDLVTTDNGLKHAVLESLFSDAKCYPWQGADFGTDDFRGWCFTDELAEHGSKVWLLLREKTTEQTEQLLKRYIETALDWINKYGNFIVIIEREINRINFQININYRGLTLGVSSGN